MKVTASILKNRGAQVEEVSFQPEANDAEVLNRIQKVIIGGEGKASFLRDIG
jgi:hypothetical protein